MGRLRGIAVGLLWGLGILVGVVLDLIFLGGLAGCVLGWVWEKRCERGG